MNIKDLGNCASLESIFNTGIPLCDVVKGKMMGLILTDAGVSFNGTEIESVGAFIEAVKEKTTAPRGQRVYPIWDLLNFEDNTGDPGTGSVGNLTTAQVNTTEAVPAFSFGYRGSEARHKRMAAMASSTLRVFFIDSNFTVYGTENADGSISGYNILQSYVNVSKFVGADAVNQYSFRLTLASIQEYRDSSVYVVTNKGILSAVGLINGKILNAGLAANVLTAQIIADGGTNLEPIYGADLAALLVTALNLETGDAVPITSMVDNPGAEGYTITIDNAAWAAMAVGDRLQIVPPTTQELADADIAPYEIQPLVIVKAA